MLFTTVIFCTINLIIDFVFISIFPILSLLLQKPISIERLALNPPVMKKPIWIHAASVGEVNAVVPLLKELIKTGKDILVTTTSITGWQRVKDLGLEVDVHLLPIDVRLVISSFVKRVNPSMLLIVETEIWPNLLYCAVKRKVPIGWINARISKSTVVGFKFFSWVFKPIFSKVAFVNAQTGVDTHRFRKVGFKKVVQAGNLKFCLSLPMINKQRLKNRFGIMDNDFVIVWGSSRPGEEEIFVDIIPQLNEVIPNLKTAIVPRHLNRMEDVCKAMGPIPFTLFSKDKVSCYKHIAVDKMGVLNSLYSVCNIAIVGGSFTDFGGHNPLEPAFYCKPIIIGPYHYSCRGSVKALKKKKGIVISNKEKLLEDIIDLYNNEEKRVLLGENAKKTISENSQALEFSVNAVKSLLVL